MSVQFCLAFLALCSLAAASDPDCADLLKPLEDQSQLSGKWIYHTGTSDNEELVTKLKTVSSSWIELSSKPDSENVTFRYADRVDGKCYPGEVNFIFSGSSINVTFHFNGTDQDHTGKYLVSCPDCVLWVGTMTMNNTTSRNIYLFTKTGKVDDSHLEVFKKQAACLNFPTELHFGGNTDLCPDEKAAATDVKKEEQ